MKEAASASPDEGTQNSSARKSSAPRTDKREAHYVAGPGFEMAIRATLAHPLKVEVRGSGQDPKDRSSSADKDHKHETLERRLDSLERAMLMVAEELQQLNRRLAELAGGPRE